MKKIDLAHRRQFARRSTYPTGFRGNAKGRLKLQTHFERSFFFTRNLSSYLRQQTSKQNLQATLQKRLIENMKVTSAVFVILAGTVSIADAFSMPSNHCGMRGGRYVEKDLHPIMNLFKVPRECFRNRKLCCLSSSIRFFLLYFLQ